MTTLGIVNVWWIYAVGFVNAGAAAFDLPSRQSLTPNLVPREDLTNAITLSSMVFQIATILGPGIAGMLIAQLWGGADLLDQWSLVHCFDWRDHFDAHADPCAVKASEANFKTMMEGLRFVFKERIIFSTMLLDFFATFFSGANTLLPIFAADILKVGRARLWDSCRRRVCGFRCYWSCRVVVRGY